LAGTTARQHVELQTHGTHCFSTALISNTLSADES